MAELKLKRVLRDLKLSQKNFAANVGAGNAAFNRLVNHAIWPKTGDNEQLKGVIYERLLDIGATPAQLEAVFEVDGDLSDGHRPIPINHEEYEAMLLRKQTLLPAARKKFALFQDPFRADAVTGHDDLFMTDAIFYVRQQLYNTARLGGFIAVIGESGAGKSTLREDMVSLLIKEKLSVKIIEPFVLAMEDNDKKGKKLSAIHIADAIISDIDPLAKSSHLNPQKRLQLMKDLMIESYNVGNRHCLVIEEAHRLPIDTLKQLKGFYELKLGSAQLMSIILIGQPELYHKLSESNMAVREVVQRCEIITLEPLDNHFRDYLAHKFSRVGVDYMSIFDDSAFAAMQLRLTQTGRDRKRHSLLYPLAINNLAAAAMNLAADLFEPKVTSDVVSQVN